MGCGYNINLVPVPSPLALSAPFLTLSQPRIPVCIYVWNHQTKVSFTSHQVKKACPGTSNSLPKMPGFKSSQEGCLSLKFKWIALGHKLSRGEGGREACSPLYQTRTSYRGTTWRGKKKKKIKSTAHGQRNWFLLFCLSCSPPIAFYHPAALAAPIPSSHYRNVNKIGAGNVAVWWKSARSMGSSHEKNIATAQISVSIIMSPIYSENELIVEWCLVIHTMPQLDGLLPRGPAIE